MWMILSSVRILIQIKIAFKNKGARETFQGKASNRSLYFWAEGSQCISWVWKKARQKAKAALLLLKDLLGLHYQIPHLQWTWWMAKAQGSWMLSVWAMIHFCITGCTSLSLGSTVEIASYFSHLIFSVFFPHLCVWMVLFLCRYLTDSNSECRKPAGDTSTLAAAAVVLGGKAEGWTQCELYRSSFFLARWAVFFFSP